MYERVLRFFELSKREHREIPPEYQICRETAYNLSLIYKQRCAEYSGVDCLVGRTVKVHALTWMVSNVWLAG